MLSEPKTARHLVLALIELFDGRRRSSHAIASAIGCPARYMLKIMAQAERAGLVRSFRGAGGGYALAAGTPGMSLGVLLGRLVPEPSYDDGAVSRRLQEALRTARRAALGSLANVKLSDLRPGRLRPGAA